MKNVNYAPGRDVCVRDSTPLPLAPGGAQAEGPLELVVPYFTPLPAAQALEKALELAHGLRAVVTLMAVHVLPYPSPLEAQEGIRERLEAELKAVARTSPVSIRVKLVFARNRADAFLGLLRKQSLVIIGTGDHWWKTPEERLARKLTAAGYRVVLIKVE